ncbi:proline iminopeptidase [Elstera cyanobacteriorum]|uniref:Proline iminopeptidase n=1 Tax=Elstera cyanobacteriorum TaxID=2022747 RepID=A0A255XK28_9PROT|nr:prolyl aminopeptidase [Elstera cyanobacteriorum]OYQ17353.1 prolyl aminopeptidase [Elstera cyanobacteriorum]GFZ93164.1 proline iminopeptidase [Elstera cyanobacteriorum]
MRTDLFPPIDPHRTGTLTRGLHRIYWEECGTPDGIPVVFLHGGPGAGASPTHRRFFDPAAYRIILFDQRGCGRSRPSAEVRDNSTQELIGDIEALRAELGVDRWLVFGGSWGSTLALAYGQAHPDRCLGFILRGIFLGRQTEIEWFLTGMRQIFPDAWQDFIAALPADAQGDLSWETLLAAYYRRLTHPDPAVHLPAAHAWSQFETRASTLLPAPDLPQEPNAATLAISRLEAHYFVHRIFLEDGQLLAQVGRIRRLPCTIVQGRYDIVCPAVSAYDLKQAWPEADLVMVPDAGHAALEPGIRAALVRATERYKLDLASLVAP